MLPPEALQGFGYHNGCAPSDAFVENFGAPRPGTQAVTQLFNYCSNGGSFGAPVSTTVFGESTTPAFGTSPTIPAFGTSPTIPAFLPSPTIPAFLPSTTPACGENLYVPFFGSNGGSFVGPVSTPVFGQSTTPAFGTSPTIPAFGTSPTVPAFLPSPTIPAFLPSTTPASGENLYVPFFGSNGGSSGGPVSTPAFGTSCTTPTFGTSSTTPTFGTSSTTPTFGTSSTPPFRPSTTPTPTFGTSTTTPTSGTSSTPPFRPSTTPKFTFCTSSTTPTFGTSSTPPFRPSTTPAFGCDWTDEYPYNPTYEICDSTNMGQKAGKLMSISGMKVYNNKSHEELRSEKYQQQRNKAQPFGSISSNCQSPWPQASTQSNVSSVQPSQSNPRSLFSVQPSQSNPQNPFSTFGANTTTQGTTVGTSTVDANTTGAKYTMVGTSAVDANAWATQGTTVGTNAFGNYNNQPLAVFGYPAFVTLTHPTAATLAGNHFGLFGSAVPVLGSQASPITVPFGVPTTGAHSTAPVSFGGPSTSFVSHSGANGANKPNSLNRDHLTAPVSIASPNVESFAGPSTSFVGRYFGKPRRRLSTINSVSGSHGDKNTCCNELKAKEEAYDCCRVPKGLEVIVDKLGYNPWSERKGIYSANKHDLEVEGGILPCEEANKDEDIIALAEFAVEQYNALHKDEAVFFMNVVVACLEAVGHGRYHIVLNAMSTEFAGFAKQRRHYAVVLRKRTPRLNHMTVLEKWQPGKAV